MNNLNYINAMRDDLFNILVLNRNIDHRIGQVATIAPTVDSYSNGFEFDYETEYEDTCDSLLVPETG